MERWGSFCDWRMLWEKQSENGRGVDRYSILLVDLTRSQPRVSTGSILSAATRNHPKRAPEARGQHEPRPAARTTAFQTSAKGTTTRPNPRPQTRCTVSYLGASPASYLDSKIFLVTAKLFPADKTSNQDRDQARLHKRASWIPPWVDPLSVTYLHTQHPHKRQQQKACLLDSPAVAVLRNCKRVVCHDDRAGKRVWSEVNSLLVDLTTLSTLHSFF